MNTLKRSIRLKKTFRLIVLGLVMFSLFGYVLPTVYSSEDKNSSEEEKLTILTNPHPLTGISDNVFNCSNDNRELHEIYLCGAMDKRFLDLTIPNLKQIVWSKLENTSCSASQINCPNTSPSCTWNQLATNTQYNLTEGGEYRIFVQYNDNSTERFYFNVYANGLNPSAVVSNIDCGNPGSITINNVPNNYEYSINNGASWQDSNVFSINSVSSYSVQIRNKTNTDSCIFNLEDIAVTNNSFNASTTLIPITCNTSKGGIKVDLSDASSSYVYEITQGGNLIHSSGATTVNTYTFADLNAGDYDINVTLASVSSCTWNASLTVPVFQTIQPNAIATKNIDCSDGIITVATTGGTAPYEYSLDGGNTYNAFTASDKTTININTSGTYTITVKDASGCEIDSSPVDIITENEITYTTIPKAITCNGNDDGSITVEVTNSQGYFTTFSLDGTTFQTSNVFSNLASGDYTLTIKKEKAGGSCDIIHTPAITVDPSSAFTASASVTQQISCGTGSATITAAVTAGGTAPFEYSTNGTDFNTSADLTGLGAGTYTITVKDSNGCTTTVDQVVSAGSNPSNIIFTTSDVDCSTGATDVQLTVENGTAPYEYKITAPSSAAATSPVSTFLGLLPNTYTFEVTTDDGCKIVRNYKVPNPVGFSSNVTVKKNVSCFDPSTADGNIEISISDYYTSFDIIVEDGTGTATGLGVTGATSSPVLISGLVADTYTVRISDAASSCEKVETTEVKAPTSALVIDSFDVSPMNCGSAGSITIEASGGWGNYAYSVRQPDNTKTPPQTSKTITGLYQEGTHTIIVADINGCIVDTQTFELEDIGGPTSIVDQSASHYCYSTTTKGELKIDVTYGEAPYFYTVNNGTPMPITGGTFTLTDLLPDDYIIKVIGVNGCETLVTDTKISGQLFALAQITKPLGCGATPDAIINVTPEEGYPPYMYKVDSGSGFVAATMPYSASTAGFYTFEVTDDKGCTFTTDAVEVINSPPLSSDTNVSKTACGKDGTGSVELIGIGGTPPFLYSFDGSPYSTQSLYTNLDAQDYTYSIKDALGCELTDILVTVDAEDAITAEVTHTNIECDVTGGTQWGNTKITEVKNATGLLTIKLIRVSDPDKHIAGTARYWTYREYNNVDMSDLSDIYDIRMYWPLHFYVEIEDEKGCTYESELYEVLQPALPWIDKFKPLDQTCANGATFEFEVGGDPANPSTLPGNELVGPFRVRLWPYDIEGTDNGQYLPFDDVSNPSYDPADPANERDYKFTGLLFGVDYSVVIIDEKTGCIRWRYLGRVDEPVAPNSGFDVISTPQSASCYSGSDGEVEFIIKGSGDNDADGIQTVNWKIYHANDRGINNTTGQEKYFKTFRDDGTANDSGSGGDIIVSLSDLRIGWYVVEVENEAGCVSGNRWLVYRPKSKLKLDLDQYVTANCNIGAQIAVTAKGGWDDQRYFNIRNKLDQTGWHEYEYAFVVDGTDSETIPASEWGSDSFKTVTPNAYDGTNNVYQVYVRDGGGCIVGLDTPITITKDDEPIIDTIDVTNRCTSLNEIYDISVSLSNPGTNPVKATPKYIWDGEVTDSATRQLGPGTHTLVVRDENGCSVSESIFIYPQMEAKSEITKTVDCDITMDNGEMLASAYGGSGNFEFTISPIPASYTPGEETNTTGIFTRLEPGINYVYTAEDLENSCPTKQSLPLQLITPVDPQFEVDTIVPVSCFGDSNGKIIIKQIDGVDNLDVTYEYSIDGSTYQPSNLFEGLAAGSYNVDIRSAKNCIQNLTGILVGGPTAPVSLNTPTVSDFTCTADNKLGLATIETIVSGGTAPYNYRYNGNSFSAVSGTLISFTVPFETSSQNINIDVIDANGCPSFITATVPAATKITATITTTTAMNCVVDGVYEINIPASFTNFSIAEQPSSSAYVTISGTTVTIEKGQPNTYSFLITDNETGCTDDVEIEIAPFNTIEVVANAENDITCYGDANGGISFIVSDFTTDFSYVIIDADTATPYIPLTTSSRTTAITHNNLPAGTYYVELTDNVTGCHEESNYISIQSPVEPLDFTFATTHELTCSPGNDAQITATPEGGWGTYEFELVDPTGIGTTIQAFDTNNVFSDLTSGIHYELTVRDAEGCNNVTKIINTPAIAPITIDPATISGVTHPSCTGANNGSITVVATGGKGSTHYQYILNNETTGVSGLPQSNPIFNGLYEGDYSVTVTDGYGCDVTTSMIQIVDPTEIEIDGIITNELSCAPNTKIIIDTGEITVSASGGVTGTTYEYRMIPPTGSPTAWSTQQVYGSLAPGTYEFLARDSDPTKHCVSPISVIRTINDIDDLSIIVNSDNTIINCHGEMDAVLVAEAAGSVGAYQYQLERNSALQGSPQDSGIFENLGEGDYRIVATSGGCEVYSDIIPISEPAVLDATVADKENIKCFGEKDGSLEISVTGGNAPYQYILSSNPEKAVNTNLFQELPAGTYSVIIQDANGCQFTVPNIVIATPTAPLEATISRTEGEVCSSDDNGVIEVSITGGTTPYSYNLTGPTDAYTSVGSATLLLDNLDGGFYEIYLKDANDCPFVLIQEVKVGSNLSAEIETSNECTDGNPIYGASVIFEDETLDTSEIVFDFDDASPNNPNVNNAQADPIFTDISPGTHTISIVHLGTGCVEVKNFNIEAQNQLVLQSLDAAINEIKLEATGGDGNYTYYINDEVITNGSLYINHSDTYNARVIDGKGCETSIEVPMEFIDIVIPNFFTPNGDGNNDTWILKNVEAFPNLWGAIYDRYGRQLKYFVKQGDWDGTYNSEDLPAGDYWYVIKLNGVNDDREFVGHVTIYR